jgi:thymidylate synthase (FAD)
MQIIKPSIEFRWITPDALKVIESAGRICYKSEDKITETSHIAFCEMLLKRKHYAMFDHASISYKIICDRGVSHEFVRHRLFGYAQESTRYCDYGKAGEIQVILPDEIRDSIIKQEFEEPVGVLSPQVIWENCTRSCEDAYDLLRKFGCSPQIARSVLPTCLKTELIVTGDFTEWRHFFKLRTSKEAHPQMREIACMILDDAVCRVKVVFNEYIKEML